MPEINFDGLVGPNHNYAGLAFGNEASIHNANQIAYPKEAALQGLKKMYLLYALGVKQAVIPPQERPRLDMVSRLGFKDLQQAYKEAPHIFSALYSASSMWTANAATVSPSSDTKDHRVHFTPANLISNFHRALETDQTANILKTIFADEHYFVHHHPLPSYSIFGDEGAANHTRFCVQHDEPGIEFFVFGRYACNDKKLKPNRYPARQTLEASQAIARLHLLDPKKTIFAQQNPEMIDLGVFHNDVISVGNQNIFVYHENAFVDTVKVIENIQRIFPQLIPVKILNSQLLMEDAIKNYFFNSQIVVLPTNKMAIIAPEEVLESGLNCLHELIQNSDLPIETYHIVDCRQSMQNGGGPACLRLRVVLNEKEIASIKSRVFLDEMLYQDLVAWVNKHYRDRLAPKDLLDPQLITEIQTALDELTQIMKLGSMYQFQKLLHAR